ncbi:MAG: helix-turn-helix transcriptional regulator [Alphaproteobacteria bacterium]
MVDKDDEILNRRIGGRIRIARAAMGLTQDKLGKFLRVSSHQIHRYEQGAGIPASSLFFAAAILDVPVSYFFADEAESEAEAILETAAKRYSLLLRALQKTERGHPPLFNALREIIVITAQDAPLK